MQEFHAARDSRDAQRSATSPADSEIVLFSNLCQVAPAVVEGLQMADYIRVQKAYELFLG